MAKHKNDEWEKAGEVWRRKPKKPKKSDTLWTLVIWAAVIIAGLIAYGG